MTKRPKPASRRGRAGWRAAGLAAAAALALCPRARTDALAVPPAEDCTRIEILGESAGSPTSVIQFKRPTSRGQVLRVLRAAAAPDEADELMTVLSCVATNAFLVEIDPDLARRICPGLDSDCRAVPFDRSRVPPDEGPVFMPRLLEVPAAGPAGQKLDLGAFSFDPLAQIPVLPEDFCAETPEARDEEHLFVVQFKPGVDPPSGFTDQDLVPGGGFVRRLSVADADALRLSSGVRWVERLHPAYKMDPALELHRGTVPAGISVRRGPAFSDGAVVEEQRPAGISRAALAELARNPDILRIDMVVAPNLRNGTTSWVIQTDRRGARTVFTAPNGTPRLRGAGQRIGLIDEPLDVEHCFLADSAPPVAGRPTSHRKVPLYLSEEGVGSGHEVGAHGTFVAGILAGQDRANPDSPARGQAPQATIAFRSVRDVGSNLYVLLAQLHDSAPQPPDVVRARVFSNSWGNDRDRGYSNWAYDVDKFMHDHPESLVIFAVGNGGLGTPENARNALAVAAGRQAGFEHLHGIGGRGPTCRDRRRKPEILVPGCRVVSALSGTACGLGWAQVHRPVQCATSWAAPAVAGAAALVRQYFLDGYADDGYADDKTSGKAAAAVPTGALVKAVLLNAAANMTGVPAAGDLYPSDEEGWGRLLLEDALFFAGDSRDLRHWDVRVTPPQQGGLPQGDPWTREIGVRAGAPLKVTLAWTDPESSPLNRTSPVVNDLDLLVTRLDCAGPCAYAGNVFSGTETPGAAVGTPEVEFLRKNPQVFDPVNNVEQVLIASPPAGRYRITVYARRVVGKGSRQGFAVVATGDFQ